MTHGSRRHSAHGVYGRLYVPLPTGPQAAAADRAARELHDIPDRVLMESAGRSAALVLNRLHPRGRIVGIAGSGHNGGDLLVMMRTLHAWGRDTVIVAVGSAPPDPVLLHGHSIGIIDGDDAADTLSGASVIVDGMLGTGVQGPPRARIADWIRRINDAAAPICALDLPSGVDATTGAAAEAVRADVTITFGWPKLGLLLHPARAHCGRLIAVEIGFPEAAPEAAARLITPAYFRHHMRPRDAAAHKGTAGRLLVLAGSEGMAGAAAIAVEAAMRAGAGLVRVASDAANRVVLQTLVPGATFLDRCRIAPEDLEPMHALVAGPGLGTDDSARTSLFETLERMAGKPALLDADALNILSGDAGALRAIARAMPLLITPHARELARITGASLEDILADMPAAARSAAHEFECVVLLKGQPSLIALPDGELLVNSVGSSDVATAGMGDQLAGTIGALLAGRMETPQAAALGLFLSGRAADLAHMGRSLLPSDVSACLPQAMRDSGPVASPLDLPFITFDQPPRR